MLICGMHVHVGIPSDEDRIDLMSQVAYFLPHLLALSGSSPFWQGQDTGLSSYRLTVFDNMPRTGLPPLLSNWSDWRRSVGTLVDIGVIEDGTKIWWDLRPSDRFPTLETRICDICPRLEDAMTLAALIQCTHRMLWRLKQRNQRWRIYDRFLLEENRWRAMRHGVSAGLIDFGRQSIVPLPELVDEWLELIAPDAEALDCAEEVGRARGMARGNAADAQRAVFEAAGGGEAGGRAVVAHLIEAFGEGL
jgi:carboxylate-amine ligase